MKIKRWTVVSVIFASLITLFFGVVYSLISLFMGIIAWESAGIQAFLPFFAGAALAPVISVVMCIVIFVGSLVPYGIGQLVENSEKLVLNTSHGAIVNAYEQRYQRIDNSKK